MPLLHIRVKARDRRHLTELATRHHLVVARHSYDVWRGFAVDAFARPAVVRAIERHGYEVKCLREVDTESRARQAQSHAAAIRRTLRGRYGDIHWADGYLTVDEVEAATKLLASEVPRCAELIELPHRSWEGRTSHALRLGKGRGARRPAICLIGGVHGREWGSPDILLFFALQLLDAWVEGRGIQLGRKRFSAAAIRTLLEHKDIVVFPQVNPDGRRFSMEESPMWRKNRRPLGGRRRGCVGVDVNRNFDFLWDFRTCFAPGAVASSAHPCDYETYIGPEPLSEPETRNVVWLLDRHPGVRAFMDLHSYSETILYSWGSDQSQSDDARMCFHNPSFDGCRGRIHDRDYREFLPPRDHATLRRLARRVRDAIERVRGRRYTIQQSVGLYPTGGTSDDYAYSRHFVDHAKRKILAFTLEWGRARSPSPFHPPYREMRRIMGEVTAGLIEFCLHEGGRTRSRSPAVRRAVR